MGKMHPNSKFEQAVARGERETNIFGLKQVVSDVFKFSKNEGIKRSNTQVQLYPPKWK